METLLTELKEKTNYSLYNIGNNKPVKLMDFIEAIENITGKKADKKIYSKQPGDVEQTWANTESLKMNYDYKPITKVNVGIENFVKWFKKYYTA